MIGDVAKFNETHLVFFALLSEHSVYQNPPTLLLVFLQLHGRKVYMLLKLYDYDLKVLPLYFL